VQLYLPKYVCQLFKRFQLIFLCGLDHTENDGGGARTCWRVATAGRSDEQLAEQLGESRNQIQRYIRLTKLEKPLLQMVDDKKLPLTIGVELSYLLLPEQNELIKAIESNKKYPSLEQAKELKSLSLLRKLNQYTIARIIADKKGKDTNPFSREFIKPYFPKNYTTSQIAEVLTKLLSDWQKQQ